MGTVCARMTAGSVPRLEYVSQHMYLRGAKVNRIDIMICTLLPFVLNSKAIPN